MLEKREEKPWGGGGGGDRRFGSAFSASEVGLSSQEIAELSARTIPYAGGRKEGVFGGRSRPHY